MEWENERKQEMMSEQEWVRKTEDELLARGHFEFESMSHISNVKICMCVHARMHVCACVCASEDL